MKFLQLFFIFFGVLFSLSGYSQDQRISIDAGSLTFSPEDSGQLSILYESDDGQLATGIGLTLHFNNSN